MGVRLEKIEHLEIDLAKEYGPSWSKPSKSRKWRKQAMNRYLRRKNRHIESNDVGRKQGRKPYKGYEY